jgi:hypothetical protein
MEQKQLTFEDLPFAVSVLISEVGELKNSIMSINKPLVEKDCWLNIEELQQYLPDHPAKATIYGWVSNRLIPCHKSGKKLRFLQKEIDEYLLLGRQKTVNELRFLAVNEMRKRK